MSDNLSPARLARLRAAAQEWTRTPQGRRDRRLDLILGGVAVVLIVTVSAFAGAAVQAITGLLPW